jgi:uncharacterized protein (DUF1330 family)
MPKGYFFVEVEITDSAAYEAYRTKVPDIISAYGGRILVRGGDPQPLDGVMPHRRRVIVEFDSPEAVKTFYHSMHIRRCCRSGWTPAMGSCAS